MFRIFPSGTLFGNLVSRQLNSPRKLKFDFETRLPINRNFDVITSFFFYVMYRIKMILNSEGIFGNVLKEGYKFIKQFET